MLIAVVVLLTAVTLPTEADPTVNPNHPVYDALEEWRIAGLVESLPPFQPYPAHELEALLETVRERGNASDRARATEYLSLIDGEPLELRGWSVGKLFTQNDELQPKLGTGISGNGHVGDSIGYGAEVGVFAIDRGADPLLPAGRRPVEDILEDNAKITVAGRTVHTLFQMQSQGIWYSDQLSLQAGIMRRAYGPFYGESPVVSASAPQTANFLFEWERPRFRFSAGLFSMTATKWFRQMETTDPAEDDEHIDMGGPTPGGDPIADFHANPNEVPGKHLLIHAGHFDLFPWLTVGLFEAVVFGPRLELAYFVPFSSLFYAQGVAAFADNSLLGFSAEVKPAERWRIPLTVYVDDADFNDFVRFNFADAKMKLAGAAALQWAPRSPLVRSTELSYEIVLPYMYTHAKTNPYTTEANFLNYLHQRENLGPSLEPNSDRLSVEAEFVPLSPLRLGLRGALIRHANASEGVLDQYLNDGGFADSGKDGEFRDIDNDQRVEWIPGDLTYNDGVRFLSQEHVQHTYQAGADLGLSFPTGKLAWDVTAGYTFEFVDGKIEYRWDSSDGPGGGETVSVGDELNHYGELQVRVRY
jgi:hypothetical protein